MCGCLVLQNVLYLLQIIRFKGTLLVDISNQGILKNVIISHFVIIILDSVKVLLTYYQNIPLVRKRI